MKMDMYSNINYLYYSGDDVYSDGEIEIEIHEIVKKHNDYSQILSNDSRWPILYHLSPVRRNLLEWHPFEAGSSLLEIGAGCGALTGLFCEKLGEVTAVELSKRRAEIIADRCKEFSNLKIIVGNISDIKTTDKYDYITLIGVLEYAGKYIIDTNPADKMLRILKDRLKPGGTLIIAIENKYGLKYWSGFSEDHTGNIFDGLEGYLNSDIRTFSKCELTALLNGAGFNRIKFYYPMPDYKLPVEIYSEDLLPRYGIAFPNYDRDRLVLFNEKLVLNELVSDGLFEVFANSFLIFASNRS